MTDAQVYAGSTVLGAVSGMRSMAAPAIVSRLASSGVLPIKESQISFLKNSTTAKTTAILAAGEALADKLPFIPNRTKALPLIARAISGAMSGAAFSTGKKRSALFGALCGMAAAIGATYGAFKLRQLADKRLQIPDTVVAIAEDALVATTGYLLLKAVQNDSKEP
ncbi:MAG: DUF4126 family protein [Acidobacteriaceae bacterium]|nr:DUF4126 family protein [Acidobacteriaceae bacterium]